MRKMIMIAAILGIIFAATMGTSQPTFAAEKNIYLEVKSSETLQRDINSAAEKTFTDSCGLVPLKSMADCTISITTATETTTKNTGGGGSLTEYRILFFVIPSYCHQTFTITIHRGGKILWTKKYRGWSTTDFKKALEEAKTHL